MIITMTKRLFILMFAVIAFVAPVTPLSMARADDNEPVIVDGRLQGYTDAKGQPVAVQLDPSGTAHLGQPHPALHHRYSWHAESIAERGATGGRNHD